MVRSGVADYYNIKKALGLRSLNQLIIKTAEISELAPFENLSWLTSVKKRFIKSFNFGISRKLFPHDGHKYFKKRFFNKNIFVYQQ